MSKKFLALFFVLWVPHGMVPSAQAEFVTPPSGIDDRLGPHTSSDEGPLDLFWQYSEADNVIKLDWDQDSVLASCTTTTIIEGECRQVSCGPNCTIQECDPDIITIETEDDFLSPESYVVESFEDSSLEDQTQAAENVTEAYHSLAPVNNPAQVSYKVTAGIDLTPFSNVSCSLKEPIPQSTVALDQDDNGVEDFLRKGVKGDINGDNNPDLALRRSSDGLIHFWLMDDQGNIREEQPAGLNCCAFPDDFPFEVVAFADMNGDGIQDIFSIRKSDRLMYSWILNGLGNVEKGVINGFLVDGYTIKEVVDMTGDGIADIFTMRDSDRLMYTWVVNADVPITQGVLHGFLVDGYTIKDVVDMNGDGKPDVLSERDSDRLLYTWVVDPDGLIRSGRLHGIRPSDYEVVDVADIDHDEDVEIVLHRQSDGIVLIWFLNDQGHVISNVVSAVQGAGWNMVAVQDMNQDTIPDVIARHDDGRVKIWMLNEQGGVASEVDVSHPQNDWTIQPYFFSLHALQP